MRHKNILLIFTDQLRADLIAPIKDIGMQTPALDRLARDSVIFDRCYTPSPVCVPARHSMNTGQYPARTGCNENTDTLPWDGWGLYQRLTDEGYRTHGIGKMHFPVRPYENNGFESRDIQEELSGGHDHYCQYLKDNGYGWVYDYNGQRSEMYYIPQNSPLPQKHHPSQWVGDRSVDFLLNYNEDRPFFLMSSFIHPHPPFAPPIPWGKLYRSDVSAPFTPEGSGDLLTILNLKQNQYKGLSVGIDKHLLALTINYYRACVSFVDYQVGRIITAMKEKGVYEDTLIIFTSDHGELLGDYNCFGKRTMLDAACRIPFLVKCPDQNNRRISSPASLVDAAPTVLSWAGIEYGPSEYDGVDLFNSDREYVYSQILNGAMGLYMIASSRDKLIYSKPDEKYYYFTKFPEERNIYNPGLPRCIELVDKLSAYINSDVAEPVNFDPAALRVDLLKNPFRSIRQDHSYFRDREENAIPKGYRISWEY